MSLHHLDALEVRVEIMKCKVPSWKAFKRCQIFLSDIKRPVAEREVFDPFDFELPVEFQRQNLRPLFRFGPTHDADIKRPPWIGGQKVAVVLQPFLHIGFNKGAKIVERPVCRKAQKYLPRKLEIAAHGSDGRHACNRYGLFLHTIDDALIVIEGPVRHHDGTVLQGVTIDRGHAAILS